MDFQSAMETFAEAWMAANGAKSFVPPPPPPPTSTEAAATAASAAQQQTHALALTRYTVQRSPPPLPPQPTSRRSMSPPNKTGKDPTGSSSKEVKKEPPSTSSSSLLPGEIAGAAGPSSTSSTGAKSSVPVHCVVETVSYDDATADEDDTDGEDDRDRRVEARRSLRSRLSGGRTPARVEADAFAIIPSCTPFSELVNAALHHLRYPMTLPQQSQQPRASIVLRNWKPLPFEKVAEDHDNATVGDVLGDLSAVATLKIQLDKPRQNACASDVKDKLLRILLAQSYGILIGNGCPLDEATLSRLVSGQIPNSDGLGGEAKRRFDHWYHAMQQLHLNRGQPHPSLAKIHHRNSPGNSVLLPMPPGQQHQTPPDVIKRSELLGSPDAFPEHAHPALQSVQSQYPTHKTRMRTSFDPELELPRLQRWFAENQHPSRHQIQAYVRELNALESRRGRKALDVNNVVYWFKNARAALKRQELRHHMPHMNGSNASSILRETTEKSCSPPLTSLPLFTSPPPTISLSSSSSSTANHTTQENTTTTRSQQSDTDRNSPPPKDASSTPPPSQLPQSLQSESRTEGYVENKLEHNEEKIDDEDMDGDDMDDDDGSECDVTAVKEEQIEYNDDTASKRSSPTPPPSSSAVLSSALVPTSRCSPTSPPPISLGAHQMLPYSSSGGAGLHMPHPLQYPQHGGGQSSSPVGSGPPAFPLVSNSLFSHSIMYMTHYVPGMHGAGPASPNSSSSPASTTSSGPNQQQHPQQQCSLTGLSSSSSSVLGGEERRKRNRTFIDPVTEVPRLEHWFGQNTHPSHSLILKYTDELNRMPYRQKFPRLEAKNVQFWFKNRRAKCKRLKMAL